MGGVNKQWEFLVDGLALTQMSVAEAQAKSSELVVSGDVWNRYNQIATSYPASSPSFLVDEGDRGSGRLIRGWQDGDGVPDGGKVQAPQHLRGRKLDGGGFFFSGDTANYCVEELEAGYEHPDSRPAANHRLQMMQTIPEGQLELQCGKFIPRSAEGMLNAQYRQQIASTRPVTVVFMNVIESKSPATSPAVPSVPSNLHTPSQDVGGRVKSGDNGGGGDGGAAARLGAAAGAMNKKAKNDRSCVVLSDESDHRPLLRLQTVVRDDD